MFTAAAHYTSDFWLMEHDMEGNLDMTSIKSLLPNAEVYEGWEEGKEGENVDFVDLYGSADGVSNSWEDCDRVYREEEEDTEEEEVLSWIFIKSEDEDIQLEWAMSSKDWFASTEDQQDWIAPIVTNRNQLLAKNAHLMIDLEAAVWEATVEQVINLKEMDKIKRDNDPLVLLNVDDMRFTKGVKKVPNE
ncbi:hypothetical protein HOY80DRAFT_1030973 [Tuber brumale]|nr:hypothetical protein HOY80DRAFT_1030973 [Tuber brumale]